jgi:hypothetical protein
MVQRRKQDQVQDTERSGLSDDAKDSARAAGAKRPSSVLSLELPLGNSKRQKSPNCSLPALGDVVPRRLVDSTGKLTIEGLKASFEEGCKQLMQQCDLNHQELMKGTAEDESKVHNRAKQDHLTICQVLDDAQGAMEMALNQHQQALKQVKQVGAQTASSIEAGMKTYMDAIKKINQNAADQLKRLQAAKV